jgi:hypothetical protein
MCLCLLVKRFYSVNQSETLSNSLSPSLFFSSLASVQQSLLDMLFGNPLGTFEKDATFVSKVK